MERLRERYICPNGDEWAVWLVIYSTDRYVQGGSDEIVQYKKNGREVGHHTRHLDKNGNVIQENFYGVTSVPGNCKRI